MVEFVSESVVLSELKKKYEAKRNVGLTRFDQN